MRTLLLMLVLGTALAAQGVSAQITPNPVAPGGTISISVTEANGVGINFPSSCVFNGIRQGSPTGPFVDGPFCLTVITPLGPCQTRTQPWTLSNALGPGLYYVDVAYYDGAFTYSQDFFPFHIGFNQPLLSASGPAQVGQTTNITLADPASPGAGFVCAASYTTNSGFTVVPGLFISLDPDLVFSLSFPAADPTLFTNFLGTLDAAGNAALALNLPALPALACKPAHLQAVVVTPAGLIASNVLNFSILP